MYLKISRIFIIGAALYIALIGALYVGQRSMLYHPGQNLPPPRATKVPEMTVGHIQTADGHKNIIWSYLPKSAPRVIVIFHGNAQNISARDIKARPLIDAGYGVVLVEYRGFGDNPGTPTESGLMDDARSAINDLIQKKGITVKDMVFYGESLGSGVAVRMASEYPKIAGLILEVPFDSALSVARSSYPYVVGLNYLMKDPYRNDLIIPTLKMPKLIMIAGRDRVIPPDHARHLFDIAANPKKKVEFPEGGHSNLYDFGAAKTVLSFLKSISNERTRPNSKSFDSLNDNLENIDPNKTVQSGPMNNIEEDIRTPALSTAPPPTLTTEQIKIVSAGQTRATLTVEIATKPETQERGLQYRKNPLPPDHGMLFIFPGNNIANFWMKDTFIPLDMIFIDQDGRIIKIHPNALPQDETIISSYFQVRAVLELNGGAAEQYGLSEGDLVLSPTLDKIVTSTMTLNN